MAILCLSCLLLFIIFGESGLADLSILKREKDRIVQKNEKINQENLSKYREIDRLKHDLNYLEKVARDELGMIKEGEVIIKPEPRTTEGSGRKTDDSIQKWPEGGRKKTD